MPKRVEKRCAGIECNGCNRVFATLFGYDQNRRSVELRGTACWALPDTTRTNLYAVSRPNMSTASLECRPVRRTRGGAKSMNNLQISGQEYFMYESIFCILRIFDVSYRPAYSGGRS